MQAVKEQMFVYWKARGEDYNSHVFLIVLSEMETRVNVLK